MHSSRTGPPAPPRVRAAWGLFAGVFVAGALTAGIGTALYLRERPREEARAEPPRAATSPAPQVAPDPVLESHSSPQSAPPPSPSASPVTRPVTFAMPIVHYHATVESPEAATGAPDGRFATIRAGTLTLQMPDGQQLISDGTPAPDLRVVADPSRPGPFRVEIGVGHNVFIAVASAAQGGVDVDIDAAGVRIGRFVRVSTRALRSEVGVDAVMVRVPYDVP